MSTANLKGNTETGNEKVGKTNLGRNSSQQTFPHSPFLYFKPRQSPTLIMSDLQKCTMENKTISGGHKKLDSLLLWCSA